MIIFNKKFNIHNLIIFPININLNSKMEKFTFFHKIIFKNFTRQSRFKLNKNILVNNIEGIKAESINIQRLQQKHKLGVGAENLKKEIVNK
jgi:hypothetical protein